MIKWLKHFSKEIPYYLYMTCEMYSIQEQSTKPLLPKRLHEETSIVVIPSARLHLLHIYMYSMYHELNEIFSTSSYLRAAESSNPIANCILRGNWPLWCAGSLFCQYRYSVCPCPSPITSRRRSQGTTVSQSHLDPWEGDGAGHPWIHF